MATLSNVSSMLIDSGQLDKSKSRLNFNPTSKKRELQSRSPADNASAGQLQRRIEFAVAEGATSVDKERILGNSDLMNVNYLERGMLAARAVGRVIVRDGSGTLVGYGTGFLISDRLMITNNHVLESKEMADRSQIEFRYEINLDGNPVESEIFGLRPEEFYFTHKDLDFSIVAVDSKSSRGTELKSFGSLPLIGRKGKVLEGEYVSCIEHPGGEYKEVALRENQIIQMQENFLWYMTDTAPGASGSPMFNDSWQVVALHHSGVPKKDADGNILTVDGRPWTDGMDESKIQWIANEGVRISSIVAALAAAKGEDPLIQAVLKDSGSGPIEAVSIAPPEKRQPSVGMQRMIVSTPSATVNPAGITIPMTINITLGNGVEAAAVLTPTEVKKKPTISGDGYDEQFLGAKVSVPKLSSSQKKDVVLLDESELIPYTHFSVCMKKTRRMANFVAWNINGDKLKSLSRQGLRFDYDDRIAHELQIGDEAYVDNKLDRGHLARRADLCWGTMKEAEDANRNSFMFTNITPQHQAFNQSERRGLWGLLENAIFEDMSVDGLKVSVMAGPIFKDDDLEYRGVLVPRDFWKVLCYVDGDDGQLKAKAYVLTQKNLLKDIEAFALDDFRLYQVPIGDLEQLTGFSFGDLTTSDTFTKEMTREAFAAGGKKAVREVMSRNELFR